MLCFLTAGLLVWALPAKNPEPPAVITATNTKNTKNSPAKSEIIETYPEKIEEAPNAENPSNPEEAKTQRDDRWFLYITGSVRSPGVYRLPPGARLVHLVEAAGGLLSFADPNAVNLAAPLEDGIHAHIPKKGERTPERTLVTEIVEVADIPVIAAPRLAAGMTPRGDKNGAPIDINRAAAEELVTLKGIGPVLAKNIVEYRRKNGPFKNIDELTRVKGIGAKKLEGFRGKVIARP
jgi:competence protein ComEA